MIILVSESQGSNLNTLIPDSILNTKVFQFQIYRNKHACCYGVDGKILQYYHIFSLITKVPLLVRS